MRATTKFVCQQCGYNSPQWMGRCPECGSWNSLVETVEEVRVKGKGVRVKGGKREINKPQRLSEIKSDIGKRVLTGFSEIDRVLGGGIVRGQVTLLAGDPGVGKSTLLLQVALNLSNLLNKQSLRSDKLKSNVLYISGEESPQQIKMRSLRLTTNYKLQTTNNLYLLAQTLVEEVVSVIEDLNPDLVIIDSIQTMESENLTGSAGSIGQVRESASLLMRVAKEKEIPVFLVGHVTKEGNIAGPMVLAHMVDTVLFLEGERFKTLRLLRSLKNRFGPVDEVGVFNISQNGINEVKNPSEFFLSDDGGLKGKAGSIVVASIEGTRPILAQIESLVLPSKLVVPRRIVSGVDLRRVELLGAVLQKTCHLPLDRFDIFMSLAGGIILREPGIDLGICLAIFSSFKNRPFPKTVAIGEVGLLGELRRVPDLEKRVKEAKKLGFTNILTAEKYKDLSSILKNYGQ